MTISYKTIRKKRPLPARTMAEMYDVSTRTVQRWAAQSRNDWINEQSNIRESIRIYHDDEGHTWKQTAEHFGMSEGAVQKRAYRARKEHTSKSPQ